MDYVTFIRANSCEHNGWYRASRTIARALRLRLLSPRRVERAHTVRRDTMNYEAAAGEEKQPSSLIVRAADASFESSVSGMRPTLRAPSQYQLPARETGGNNGSSPCGKIKFLRKARSAVRAKWDRAFRAESGPSRHARADCAISLEPHSSDSIERSTILLQEVPDDCDLFYMRQSKAIF